jgi:hypothetical protein
VEQYEKLSPMQFQKLLQRLTIADAVMLDWEGREQLNQLHGTTTDEFIVAQIISIGEYLDKSMSIEKACQVVADIFEKYWFFTLNDVLLFLKKGRQGEYNEHGQISLQYNPQTILLWAGKYEVERTEYISKQRIAENQERKSDSSMEVLYQDLYKGAVYSPENENRQSRQKEQQYSSYKAKYAYHKANGSLDEFLGLKDVK